MTPPRALLLDAMGTLIGLRRPVGELYAEAAADHGLTLEAADLDRAFLQAYRSAPPLAFPGTAAAHLEQAERHWWQQRIAATFAAAGVPQLPMGLAADLFDRFADPAPWGVYPEVPTALERWRTRGLRLVVVSNFDRRLHRLLQRLGLRDALEEVVVSSEVGAAKPDPAPLTAALALLELPAAQVWHIGDSDADEAAAAAAGIRCLRLARPGGVLLPAPVVSEPDSADALPAPGPTGSS
jgi:putative hydrolase of the HAD superfamily